MKRILDLIIVFAFLPMWLPLLFWVAVLTLIFMGRPVLFFQERSGLKGAPFRIMKFRTMKGAESSGLDDAARLTKFGRFLRATSLDELPELLRVITGKMSLVGPRPMPVRYLERYSEVQKKRLEVLPGITGWAQVHGRNSLSWERKFSYDVWYVENHSVWLDLRILFMTVWTVVSAGGVSAEGEATVSEFKGRNER